MIRVALGKAEDQLREKVRNPAARSPEVLKCALYVIGETRNQFSSVETDAAQVGYDVCARKHRALVDETQRLTEYPRARSSRCCDGFA